MTYRELRRALRLEVSGNVTTRLVALDLGVHLRDVGPGGFQISSPVPIAPESVHTVQFTLPDGWTTTLTARTVHARRVPSPIGPATYAVGFAFVFNPAEGTEHAVAHLIDRLTAVLSFD